MSAAKTQVDLSSVALQASLDRRQRQRMLVALALLLIALIVVIAKDRQFWFPSTTISDADDYTPGTPATATTNPKPKTVQRVPPARAVPKAEISKPEITAPASAPLVARTTLPPLEVEVVSGNERHTIPTRNPSIKVDLQAPASTPAGEAAVSTPASERVRLSPNALEIVSRPVQPSYPLLAKQMKVQGSVVLNALIGKDGLIQDLQVLSGPTILSDAARQAVKQWRFKPYLQSGQPVETEARITVNFTISTD